MDQSLRCVFLWNQELHTLLLLSDLYTCSSYPLEEHLSSFPSLGNSYSSFLLSFRATSSQKPSHLLTTLVCRLESQHRRIHHRTQQTGSQQSALMVCLSCDSGKSRRMMGDGCLLPRSHFIHLPHAWNITHTYRYLWNQIPVFLR